MVKPWVNSSISEKCTRRDSLLKSIHKEKDPTILSRLRNEFKTPLTNAEKRNSIINFFESNKRKTSKLWEVVRVLVNMSSSKSNNIKLLDEDTGKLISDKGIRERL